MPMGRRPVLFIDRAKVAGELRCLDMDDLMEAQSVAANNRNQAIADIRRAEQVAADASWVIVECKRIWDQNKNRIVDDPGPSIDGIKVGTIVQRVVVKEDIPEGFWARIRWAWGANG